MTQKMKARLLYIVVVLAFFAYVLQGVATSSVSGPDEGTYSWFDGR